MENDILIGEIFLIGGRNEKKKVSHFSKPPFWDFKSEDEKTNFISK
jgi:predicted peptidase